MANGALYKPLVSMYPVFLTGMWVKRLNRNLKPKLATVSADVQARTLNNFEMNIGLNSKTNRALFSEYSDFVCYFLINLILY